MPPAYVEAIKAATPHGISFDGLEVQQEENGFTYRTPEDSYEDLSATDLDSVATGCSWATNWFYWHSSVPQRDDYWTFLRWIERASSSSSDSLGVKDRYERLEGGISRQWGEIVITVRLGEAGERRYLVCHEGDGGSGGDSEINSGGESAGESGVPSGVGPDADLDNLDLYTDPRAAREIARFDGRGRYRPLKTAPTLRSGWLFADLSPFDLLEVLENLYPATVSNWHLEREGYLDVTHWHDAVTRQTGIYSLVERWDRGEGHEHVNLVAQACCVDSQCLKRREWEYDEEISLSVESGTAEFPCREPCPLVISAARKWTRLEAEEADEYVFELTPSEREQFLSIVDAVSEGRIDDIREADFDDPANRYRVRFLQAKHFDDSLEG